MTANLPQLALDQFTQRRRYQQRQRADGKISAEEADARLFPWLALALRCGAPAEALDYRLPALLEAQRGGTAASSSAAVGETAFLSERQARALVADDHCPLAEALAVLAKARDAALDALARNEFTDAASASRAASNAQALALIGRHFPHTPPYQGKAFATERKAA